MFERQEGQIALPFILLVSGIILEITVAGSFVAYFLSSSGAGERLLVRATAAANAGVRDAMLKIAQNKEYTSTSGYTLSVSNDSATVIVTRDTSTNTTAYIYTITSTASAGTRRKKLVATALVHKINGKLTLQSIIDTPID